MVIDGTDKYVTSRGVDASGGRVLWVAKLNSSNVIQWKREVAGMNALAQDIFLHGSDVKVIATAAPPGGGSDGSVVFTFDKTNPATGTTADGVVFGPATDLSVVATTGWVNKTVTSLTVITPTGVSVDNTDLGAVKTPTDSFILDATGV